MQEQIVLTQTAALYQREGTGGAQSSRCVGAPSPYRFHLDVPHPAQKKFRLLIFESGERPAEGILGPALRIPLDRILEESIKGQEQIGHQIGHPEIADEVCSFCHDEVVAV